MRYDAALINRLKRHTAMETPSKNHIFGPVPSRRLGRSLGVDLVPFKTCTYDCIYCQLSRTTCKTLDRREYVPLDDVISQLKAKLSTQPDYITLSGSGEPTLFSRTGELIDRIKAMTDVPVAVLTNGSLLWRKDVRDQLMNADLVVPSLDAGDEATFRSVNRPHEEITFEKMLNGLVDFRREFSGQYWLEILLLGGYTAMEAELVKLARCIDLINPDRVQLNTVTRPPAESFAVGVSRDRLGELAAMLTPPVEVIADFRSIRERGEFSAGREDILEMLRRRPCSMEDIADGLGMHLNEVTKHLEELTARNEITNSSVEGKLYYKTQ